MQLFSASRKRLAIESKEVRIGLAVVGTLLVILLVVAVWRLGSSSATPTVEFKAPPQTNRQEQPTILKAESGPPANLKIGPSMSGSPPGGPKKEADTAQAAKSVPGGWTGSSRTPRIADTQPPPAFAPRLEMPPSEPKQFGSDAPAASPVRPADDRYPDHEPDDPMPDGVPPPLPGSDGPTPRREPEANVSQAAPVTVQPVAAPPARLVHDRAPVQPLRTVEQPLRTVEPPKTATPPERVQPGREYLIEEGDTLQAIALYELGDARRWQEIHQLNLAILGEAANELRPGTRIRLPATRYPTDSQ